MSVDPVAYDGAHELLVYVGAGETDAAFAADKYAEAYSLVVAYLGDDLILVPEVALRQAALEVGSKLWARRRAPEGAAQYTTIDSTPMPTPRDPLVTVYPTLRRYMRAGLA